MSKKEIDHLIKDYVKKRYPNKVEQYHQYLKDIRISKLNRYKNIIFIDNELMWQDNKETISLKMNILEAKRYCKYLNLASKRDWRLPKYSELLRLVNYYRFEPANIDGLLYVNNEKYWSISPSSTDISANWYVDFNYGETGTSLKYRKFNIRCVRDISKIEGEF